MADDDQERFEDYLELEHYIEELQAGKAAHLPPHLTPGQARIYRIAAQFCSASPGADEPDAQFVSDLEARLLDQLKEEQQEITEKRVAVVPEPETPPVERPLEEQSSAGQPQELPTPYTQEPKQAQPQITRKPARRSARVSRRAMLAGGAVAAASLAIGTGVGTVIGEKAGVAGKPAAATTRVDKTATPTYDERPEYNQPWLVDNGPDSFPTTWHFVTTLAQLGDQAVQFSAGGVIGYVILEAGSQWQTARSLSDNDVIAISAACTHMGCIVQWRNSDRLFHCPCHNGLFTQNGLPDDNSQVRYLAALPRLRVKVDESGNIYVEVPKSE
jgi:Rieske Fe-S protein